jgi:hypothetical protein
MTANAAIAAHRGLLGPFLLDERLKGLIMIYLLS